MSSEKITAQQVFKAFKETFNDASPEDIMMFVHIPEQYEQLSEEQRTHFQQMAWKMNLIIGEFDVEASQ